MFFSPIMIFCQECVSSHSSSPLRVEKKIKLMNSGKSRGNRNAKQVEQAASVLKKKHIFFQHFKLPVFVFVFAGLCFEKHIFLRHLKLPVFANTNQCNISADSQACLTVEKKKQITHRQSEYKLGRDRSVRKIFFQHSKLCNH